MSGDRSIFSWLSVSERTSKPRTTGLNMVMALHIAIEGMNMLADLVSWAGDYIDYYKVGNDMTLRPREVVLKRLAFLKEHGIEPYAQGGVTGKAVKQGCIDVCLDELVELGISVVEASRIVLTMPQMLEVIQKGKDRGLTVFAEVGKKYIGWEGGPKTHMSADDVIREMQTLLNAGAFKVIYEFMETVSLLKENEGLEKLLEVVGTVGKDNIMLEVPVNAVGTWDEMSRYAAMFIDHFGPNVNLGNISVDHVMGIESLRHNFSAISAVGKGFSSK
ncbi:MAG: phosphosulfolactate synthase [Deltaproteobacteria bacterium]|nr:phosphosulfolactate synthase [Deltaproteobacteria bacterium]